MQGSVLMDPPSRHGRRAWPAGVALFAAIVLAAGALLVRERLIALDQTRADVAMLSTVMEEHSARTFDSVDIALASVAQRLAAGQRSRHDPAIRELMRDLLRQLPTVRALFVVGPDGFIQHDTDYPGTPDISLADRPYYQAFVRQADLQRHLSAPLKSRSGLGWFTAVSQRIPGPPGSFRGIVVAAVQLDTVAALYRRLGLGESRELTLFHRDGTVMARYPDDGQTGRRDAQSPLFAQWLPRAGSGVIDTAEPPERILAYRALPHQDLVVVVAMERDRVLAGWRRALDGAVAALAVLGLLIAAGVRFYLQRQQHRERAHAHRAAAESAEAMAEQMRAVARELSRTDERKTEFLATLSHELRNVLAPIQNGLLILERAPAGSRQAERALAIVRSQVAQMRHLVDDLLDLARVNSGKVRLQLERLDLRDVVTQACAAAQATVDAAGHRLAWQAPADAIWIDGDRGRLLQVLANLLGNANKYTPPGSGEIVVSVATHGDRAAIEVRDNGLGIPPHELANVFRMFEQVADHQGRSQGGLGIGLALVARLVGLHGGEVVAHSDGEGRGSTFTVSLPLAAPAVGAQDVAKAAADTAATG